LSVLISCTAARAVSALAQKVASDWRASRSFSRSDLAGRSKKVSQLGDPFLQLGQTIDQFGHVLPLLALDVV
jgi:hypothetical protein